MPARIARWEQSVCRNSMILKSDREVV
jgi:hypothetical protein